MQEISFETMTKTVRNILLYAECCLVDHGGLLEGKRMNSEDMVALGKLKAAGILDYGRIPHSAMHQLVGTRDCSHWVTFTDVAFELAASIRRQRAINHNSHNRRLVDEALAAKAAT